MIRRNAIPRLTYLLGCAVIIFSCSDPVGFQDKTINLSQDMVSFNSSADSIKITTEGTSWWISNVSLNNTLVDIDDVNTTDATFEIIQNEFTIIRQSTMELFITMTENPNSQQRVLDIFLSEGNTGDLLTIEQAGQ